MVGARYTMPHADKTARIVALPNRGAIVRSVITRSIAANVRRRSNMNTFNVLLWVLIGLAILAVAGMIDIIYHDCKLDRRERGDF